MKSERTDFVRNKYLGVSIKCKIHNLVIRGYCRSYKSGIK